MRKFTHTDYFILLCLASNSSSGSKSVLINPSIPVVFASLISSCEKLEEFGKASFVIVSYLKYGLKAEFKNHENLQIL